MISEEKDIIYRLMGKFSGYWLIEVRKLSSFTISAYRDSCRSYLRYLKETNGITASKVLLEHFSREFVAGFLKWLNERHLSVATVNLRLTVLKAFARFAMDEEPRTWECLHGVTTLKPLRHPAKKKIKHLTKPQLKTLFSVIDLNTRSGIRNYMMIAFCYITAARVAELTAVKLKDIIRDGKKISVRLYGKGSKTRIVPLEGERFLGSFESYLRLFHSSNSKDDYLFYTNYRERKVRIARSTVDTVLKKLGARAVKIDPNFPEPLHCHILRHSRAMHLHAEGMPIAYLRDFLGHSSIESTSIYAWTDVATMRRELKKVKKLRTQALEKEKNTNGDPDTIALKLMGLT